MKGHEKVLATAQQIVMNLTDKDGARPQELIREFSQFDPRFADLQSNVRKGGKGSVGEAGKVLDLAEVNLRPWIGNTEVAGGAHLWEGPRGDIDAFLLAVDQVQFVLGICGAASDGAQVQEKAQVLLRLSIARIEEELRHLLEVYSKPYYAEAREAATANPPDAVSLAGTDAGQGETNLVRLPLVSESVEGSLRELVTKLLKAGFPQSAMSCYKRIRKGVIDQTLAKLGLLPLSGDEIHRLDWDELEKRIDVWQQSVGIAIRIVFASERALCDKVFVDEQFAEVCLADLALGGVSMLLGFSESVASGKRSPEKLFRVLEMYETVRDFTPNFYAVFSGDACKHLRDNCEIALLRISDAAQGIFSEFENAIKRDATKQKLAGGAVHGLTRYVVNYLILLYDYRSTVSQVFRRQGNGFPVPKLLAEQQMEGEEEGFSDDDNSDEGDENRKSEQWALAETNKWKLHVLQKNLEEKAKLYEDPAEGHVFMMNNIHYIASKVKFSDLRGLVGDDWIRQQAAAVRHHANMYQRQTWTKLLNCLRDDLAPSKEGASISRNALKDRFKQCNAILEEIHRVQSQWVVPETPLREELRAAITERLLGSYRSFYGRYARVLEGGKHASKYIKYAPGDVEAMIRELFKDPDK